MSAKTNEEVRKLNLKNTEPGVIYLTRWKTLQAGFYLICLAPFNRYLKINVKREK